MKYIYALVDPRSRQIRYIGQTEDLSKRLLQHIAERANTPKGEWIREMTTAGVQPEIIQLAIVRDGENAHEIEYRWVYLGRKNGWELTNTMGMKSEDYYSLHGYFDKLIVEIEKPEDVISRNHTMADAKQELINLLVEGVRGLSQIPNVFRSGGAACIFCVASLFFCLAMAYSHRDSEFSMLGGISSAIGGFITVGFVIDWLSSKEDRRLFINQVLRLIGFALLCIGLAIAFAA